MKKQQKIRVLLILTFMSSLFAFRFIWQPKEAEALQISIKDIEKKTTAIVEPCMKPAWYRFFIPQNPPTNPKLSKSSPLHFLIEKNTTQNEFLNVTLLNTSQDDIVLPTQNRSLLMIQEAKDPNGVWKPIEYWNKDWQMGKNNKEEFTLAKNKSIFCTVPLYKGDFKTKIRLKLQIVGAHFTKKIIYSPEFTGQIQVGQFHINWNQETRLKPENVSYLDE